MIEHVRECFARLQSLLWRLWTPRWSPRGCFWRSRCYAAVLFEGVGVLLRPLGIFIDALAVFERLLTPSLPPLLLAAAPFLIPLLPRQQDIFTFFIRQLKHLTTPADPHFAEYFYLIESLSNVKSVCLICDLDGGDELMKDMFATCFDVIRWVSISLHFGLSSAEPPTELIPPSTFSSASPKNVEICLADILLQLLEEATTLSTEVVDTLLAQFLPSSVKKRPAAFRLAVDVCTGGSDKLQRYVCQYFAEQITSEIEGTGDRSEDEDTASEDGKRKSKKGGIPTLPQAFITAHSLIRQINRSVPSLLTNVIPQLEEELVTDKGPEYRKLATEVLGQMLGEKMGQGDLAAKYPATWRNWLARGRDKAVVVRIAMTEALGKIWGEHPELVADIEGEFLLLGLRIWIH